MKHFILFLIFSFFGEVGAEVFFSSIHDYIRYRDIAFKGRSYLWVFSLYGIWGIIISPLYNLIEPIPFVIRGFIYLAVIFIGEFIYGYILKLTIKKCPWEYKGSILVNTWSLVKIDLVLVTFQVAIGSSLQY